MCLTTSDINELKNMYSTELHKEVVAYAGGKIAIDEIDHIVESCINRMDFSFSTMHRNMKTYASILVEEYNNRNKKN